MPMTGPTSSLHSLRLLLRPAIQADTGFLVTLLTNPQSRRYLGGPVPQGRLQSALAACLHPAPPDLTWLVIKDTTPPLGLIHLSRHSDSGLPELSYQFHPDAWGHGHAVEAASQILRHAAETLHHSTVLAETQSANRASRRLLMRLGMVEQSRLIRFRAEQIIFRWNPPTPPNPPLRA